MKIDTFVKKAVKGHVNPVVFLKEHRDYLMGFRRIVPILVALEKKTLFPTAALKDILTLIVLEKDPEEKTVEELNEKTGEIKMKSPKQLEKVKEKKVHIPKKYQLFLILKDADGNEFFQDETYEADTYQEATRISHTRLFRREDSIRMDVIGGGVTTGISRDDAMRELLGKRIGGSMAVKKTASSGGGYTCKSKAYSPKFSKG